METAQDMINRAGNENKCEKCGNIIAMDLSVCQDCINKTIEEDQANKE